MSRSVKFYKIKLTKKILDQINQTRGRLLEELVTNATDPNIYKRRIRMLKHLNLYENQLLEKIHNFQTDNVFDLLDFDPSPDIRSIINRSA